MEDAATQIDGRVDHREQAPEDELHVHRRTAEDPQVEPRDALDDRVVGDSRMTARISPRMIAMIIENTVSSRVTSAAALMRLSKRYLPTVGQS